MNLVPPEIDSFLKSEGVASLSHAIARKVEELINGLDDETQIAKVIFEWVRDHIPHTKDIGMQVVTCDAISVFEEGTGICFAKSHLVAAMMRHAGIPCGYCYQIFEDPAGNEEFVLHGLNAVFLKETQQWHRIDPRGNRDLINGQFSITDEKLAFPEMTFLDDCVYAQPLEEVITGLNNADSIAALWKRLPTASQT